MNEKTQKQKKCIKCEKVKILDKFTKDSSRKSGFKEVCKECRNARRRAIRAGDITPRATKVLEIDYASKTRECRDCGLMVSWDMFGKDGYRKDGMTARCKLCRQLLWRSEAESKGIKPKCDKYITDYEARMKECSTCRGLKPFSSFDLTDRDQLLKCCNFSNLQPLWAEDNNEKGTKPDIVPEMIGPLYW